jgi:hypothetical protein
MIRLLDKETQNRNSKISTRITKAHKPRLGWKDLNSWTWFKLELTLERFRASDKLDQKRYGGKERLTIDLHI